MSPSGRGSETGVVTAVIAASDRKKRSNLPLQTPVIVGLIDAQFNFPATLPIIYVVGNCMSAGLRRSPRQPFQGRVRVAWEDDKRQMLICIGKVVDISLEGMQVAVPEPLPLRSMVQFQLLEHHFEGTANVRSCYRNGMLYRAGMQFCGGLQWKQPQAC